MARRGALRLSLLLAAALATLAGCKRFQRKHIPVESLEALPYPTCNEAPAAPLEPLGGLLRAGPTSIQKDVAERYSARRDGCIRFRGVQDWPRGGTDLEVVYDAKLTPLRVWKRMRIPGLKDSVARAEVRKYELRTEPVGITRKAPDGLVTYEQLKGGRPVAVIGPGRGLLTMWIKRAQLAPGQKVRELVLDIRALEKIEPVTLLREPDMDHQELGRVRVYTFYGRETVFADQQDRILGDLAGMRPDESATKRDGEVSFVGAGPAADLK